MIKLISKVTRPNTKATFYPMSDTLTPLVKKAKQEGKLIAEEFVLSKNKLTFTSVWIWSNKADLEEFNQNNEIKEYRKCRKWFEQEYEHTRSFKESEVDELNLDSRM